MYRHVRHARAHLARESLQPVDGGGDLAARAAEQSTRALDDLGVAVQVDQRLEHAAERRRRTQRRDDLLDLRPRLALQRAVQPQLVGLVELRLPRETPEHPDVPEIEMHVAHSGERERLQHEADHLAVALDAGVPVELRAHLHRRARAREAIGQRVQHGADVAKPHRLLSAERLRVDARDLRRHVGAHPHHPAGQLIRQLEGGEIEVVPGADEQGVEILDEGRDDELVAPAGKEVDEPAAQTLEAPRLGRQDLVDALRE